MDERIQHHDVRNFNLSKTDNVMINSYGHKLHFRIFSPNSNVEKNGVCFWVHGFGGHSNRPEVKMLGNYFTLKGYYVLALGN